MNGIQFVSTLTRKSRSNFYYAFLFLPRPRREALYAVYAFCRIVDDVADLGSNPARQRAALNDWRAEVARCYTGRALQTPGALRRDVRRPSRGSLHRRVRRAHGAPGAQGAAFLRGGAAGVPRGRRPRARRRPDHGPNLLCAAPGARGAALPHLRPARGAVRTA